MTDLIPNIYKTKDLAEAAAQLVVGMELETIERDGPVCWFVFKGKDQCQKLANTFYFGELLVNARSYHEAQSVLKNRIFNG